MRQGKGGRERFRIDELTGAMWDASVVFVVGAGAGIAAHLALRALGLRWTWAIPLAALGLAILPMNASVGFALAVSGVSAAVIGFAWQRAALERGGEEAQRERARPGMASVVRGHLEVRSARRERVRGDRLAIGETRARRVRTVPFGRSQGVRCMIVGAPGSGKSVTSAAIACAYIGQGYPVKCIDPKGDDALRDNLARAAEAAGVPFLEWSHAGPAIYNPLARGDSTEVADKALSAEEWSEPHYLRQAQRYLGWEVKVLRSVGIEVSTASLARYLDPEALEPLGDRCPNELAEELRRYLDSLSARQRADLGGVRDRLATLAESELGRWLDPQAGAQAIDLASAWASSAVVYFRLDADRYPLASEMLGAAIVSDLVALTGELQGSASRGLVVIDEFAAVGARNVLRVLSRSRSAGISVALATQGVADLEDIASEGSSESFARRVLTQLDFVIAHRQPESTTAESLARLAGTQPVWVTTRRIGARFGGDSQESVGTRTREREFIRNPDEFKRLATGEAIVIEPAARMQAEVVRVWPASWSSRRPTGAGIPKSR